MLNWTKNHFPCILRPSTERFQLPENMRTNKNPIKREYCKYMPNDTMIEKWVTGKDDVSNADFPMVVDPIHKILYCELPKVGSSNWKRVLIKLTDPRYEDVKNVLGKLLNHAT